MRSTLHESSVVPTILPIVCNDDTEGTGTAVDLRGYGGATVVFAIGASGDTLSGSVKLAPKVQHSDAAGSGFVDVPAAELDGGQPTEIDAAAEDEIVVAVGYLGTKRYLRAFVDMTGTHTAGTPLTAVIIRSLPTYLPAS
jgi:hypothetical protein